MDIGKKRVRDGNFSCSTSADGSSFLDGITFFYPERDGVASVDQLDVWAVIIYGSHSALFNIKIDQPDNAEHKKINRSNEQIFD